MRTFGPSSVGLALIARDEEETLPTLLGSIEGAFDQVVLLDTGSVDATRSVFEEWGRAEAGRWPGFRYDLGRFAWRDDFAAARNAADALLRTAWWVWADADDEILGAGNLRRLAAKAPSDVVGFVAGCDYLQAASGRTLGYVSRIRMVRGGRAYWRDRLHEEWVVDGRLVEIPVAIAEWRTQKSLARRTAGSSRNLRVAQKWLEDEPDSPKALQYAGKGAAVQGNHEDAVGYFRRLLGLSGVWEEERAHVQRQLAISLMALGRWEEAEQCADAARAALPSWPDSYLTLAEVCLHRGDDAGAIEHARKALELGPPGSPLPHLPLDYVLHPRLLIATALRNMGHHEQAAAAGQDAIQAMFGEPAVGSRA
jgi:tetratricopeptide (TPR) repeat protein